MPERLHYSLGFSQIQQHALQVTLEFETVSAQNQLEMANWCPGSYLIRDYARYVSNLSIQVNGADVAVNQISKNQWDFRGKGRVKVSYLLYGHELSVRTNHFDHTHAFLHSPAVFMFPADRRDSAVSVVLNPDMPSDWRVATGLTSEGKNLVAANIDELFDCPIHAGVGHSREFSAAGRSTKLFVWGAFEESENFHLDRLCGDLKAVIEKHAERFGGVPYNEYTFVLMLAPGGYGGLEHKNSSANIHSSFVFRTTKSYADLLELLSHEYFHLWNGKRLFPEAFQRFDYARENYTRCLWVVEGLTSYYDRLTVRLADRMTVGQYAMKLAEDWSRFVAVPGRLKHSLEESSLNAWVKLYKPDECNLNTTVSYYLKGGIVALALDFEIREKTGGKKTLSDVVAMMYRDYADKGRGYPEALAEVFSTYADVPLKGFFEAYVSGRQDPDLNGLLGKVGLEMRGLWEGEPKIAPVWLGVQIQAGARLVAAVSEFGPAGAAGIQPFDEVIAVNRFTVSNDNELRQRLAARGHGEEIELAVVRRGQLVLVKVPLAAAPHNRFEVHAIKNASSEAQQAFTQWLGAPFPAPGMLGCFTLASFV